MSAGSEWQQRTLVFADPRAAEQVAADHLAPLLADLESQQLIDAWFYVRKGPWRLRLRPTSPGANAPLTAQLTQHLTRLRRAGHLTGVTPGIYEPETHAFGGPAAMAAAHQLWHHDSRHLLNPTAQERTHRRELSTILCAAMMRAAELDLYEQADVWARVADHRDPPPPAHVDALRAAARRLITVDPTGLVRAGAALAPARQHIDAHTTAGATLGQLNHTGRLRRGLRAVLAHHVIFAWNRRGIPGPHQAALATAAASSILGPATDPELPRHPCRARVEAS